MKSNNGSRFHDFFHKRYRKIQSEIEIWLAVVYFTAAVM